MAGGYTPTIIARNQFVAVTKSKAESNPVSKSRPSGSVSKADAMVQAAETAAFPQHAATLTLNETVKLETAQLLDSPTARFKQNQFMKTAKFGGPS